jgi:hypothetical protein
MATANVDAVLRHVDRALRSRNLNTLVRDRAALEQVVATLRSSEAAARARCEGARNRHNKKRICREHARLQQQLKDLMQRHGYVRSALGKL